MNNPNAAYLATSPYIYAYFRQQHPAAMRWTQLLAGISAPDNHVSAKHLELGFGQGLGLAITAATSDALQVGVDFMPAQVASLDRLLTDAGVRAHLHQSDFATFLATNQDQFQSISLHGVWSWVAPEIRQQVIRIIQRFLTDDGMVYISHNTLPGRAPILPMQRLLHHTAQAFAEHADDGLQAALAVMQSMMPISCYVSQTPVMNEWWHSLAQENPRYLAHEYLGQAWSPLMFADTAALLADAGLQFACSADAIELLPELHLTTEQQTWLSAIPDAVLKQSYQDMLRNVGFRRDIWRKSTSVVPLDQAAQAALLLDQYVVLLHPLGALDTTLVGTLGAFEMPQPMTDWMLAYLAEANYQPKQVKCILARLNEQLRINSHQANLSLSEMIPLLIGLTAIGAIHPSRDREQHEPTAIVHQAQRLNEQLIQYAWQDNRIEYLASPVAGCGIQVSRLQQLLLIAYMHTATLVYQQWAMWLWNHRDKLTISIFSVTLTDAAEQYAWLEAQAKHFARERFNLLIAHKMMPKIEAPTQL